MPEVLAHAGGHLFDTIVQLAVFLGPVPAIFYFLVRAMRDSNEDEREPSPRDPGLEHVEHDDGRDRLMAP